VNPAPPTSTGPISRPSQDRGRAPWLTVVIVSHNSWSDVRRLVATLAATAAVAAEDAEVVVVDHASQGPIPIELTAPAAGIRLVARAENNGFAAGVNSGWRAACGRWLLVLNPDVIIADHWLDELIVRVKDLEAGPAKAPGIVGFGLRNPDGSRQPSVGAFPNLARTLWEQLIPRERRKYQADWRTRQGPVPWVTGACMLVNTRLLDLLGGMDEDFFLYYEEVALCGAAWRRGWRVDYDPTVEVTHLRPLQNRALSPKMRVITRHSKLLYFRKHLPYWQFLGLSWIVTLEATLLEPWSRFRGRTEDVRSWRTIGEVARAFRAGDVLRGRDVRGLAESVTRPPVTQASGTKTHASAIGSARKRRGARNTRLLQPRKDGPACR
jgi:N-acetylglucosaminyl-diphospho-decaprenol L-rhamnosyltransferase